MVPKFWIKNSNNTGYQFIRFIAFAYESTSFNSEFLENSINHILQSAIQPAIKSISLSNLPKEVRKVLEQPVTSISPSSTDTQSPFEKKKVVEFSERSEEIIETTLEKGDFDKFVFDEHSVTY